MSCMTPPGEDSWELGPGFLQISPYVPFLFADVVLFSFTVISHHNKHGCMLSPVIPPRESLNLGVILRSPDTLPQIFH